MSGAVPRKQGNKGSAQVLRLHDVVSRFRTLWDSAEHPGRNHADHNRISKASFQALLDHPQISNSNKTNEITFCFIDKRGTRRNPCSFMPGQPTSCFLVLPQNMCSCLWSASRSSGLWHSGLIPAQQTFYGVFRPLCLQSP